MEDVIGRLANEIECGRSVALSSLVWSTGSIPMSDQAKMLVLETGELVGTIGGGCLEAEVYAAGQEALRTGTPCDLRYTMTEKQAGENGLNCGGTVRLYTECISPEQGGNLYRQIARARAARESCILATQLNGATRILWGLDGTMLGETSTSHEQLKMLGSGVEEKGTGCLVTLEDGAGEFFIEPFLPQPIAYVFGGGHVGGQVAALAKNVGFYVVLIDDRAAFAHPERHPYADRCMSGDIKDVFSQLDIDEQSYVVALTRGHQYDEVVVECAVKTKARYVGMLGSERKKMLMWKVLERRGIDSSQLNSVFAPVGLNIGADTPEEIAVSVVAEMIRVRRGVRKIWKTKKEGGQ
jgi:xanthine dehydrogenase accessory factor